MTGIKITDLEFIQPQDVTNDDVIPIVDKTLNHLRQMTISDLKSVMTGMTSTIAWEYINNKPTTLSGYGITDSYTSSQIDQLFQAYAPNLSIASATNDGLLSSSDWILFNSKADGNHLHTGVYEPANSNIQNHITNTNNPHNVTASQVGTYTSAQINTALSAKQDLLVSGTNIKTINGTSVLGSGDITISAPTNDTKEFTLTTSVALTTNKPCFITTSGTLTDQPVSNTATFYNAAPIYSPYPIVGSVSIPDTNNVVLFYNNNSNNTLTSVVATINGNIITYGISVTVAPISIVKNIQALYDTVNNIIVIKCEQVQSPYNGYIIAGTISGTSLNFGSPVIFGYPHGSNIAINSQGNVLLSYVDEGDGRKLKASICIYNSVSKTYSIQSPITLVTSQCFYPNLYYIEKDNSFILIFQNTFTNLKYLKLTIDVLSNTVLINDTVDIVSNLNYSAYLNSVYISAKNMFVLTYFSTLGTPFVSLGYYDNISNKYVFNNTQVMYYESEAHVIYDELNDKLIFTAKNYQNNKTYTYEGKIFNNTLIINNNMYYATTNGLDSLSYNKLSGKVLIFSSIGGYYSSFIYGSTTINNFIGFSKSNYSINDIATVLSSGSTITTTGLAPNQKYYIDSIGNLTNIKTDIIAGIAVSSTKLFVDFGFRENSLIDSMNVSPIGINTYVKTINNKSILGIGDIDTTPTLKTINGTSILGSGDISISGGTSVVTSVNTKTGDVVLTKTDINLGNVDNTSDLDKPISTATQAALDTKIPGTWNSVDATYDVNLTNYTMQLGQDTVFYGKATEDILAGQVVMFAGAQGDHILLAKATVAQLNNNPHYLVGIASQAISTNNYGYITWIGEVSNANTSSFLEGSILYLDANNPGMLTTTTPVAPNIKIVMASCLRVHTTQGVLLVRPNIGAKIDTLHNVNISSVSNNDILKYNNTNNRWENVQLKTINNNSLIGSGDIVINGTTDLSNYYTKTEIDTMIGNISSALDAINGTII